MIKTKFKFGEEVRVLGYLVRRRGYPNKRFWERFTFPRPVIMLFLGGRKLMNGKVEYESHGFEGGDYYFKTDEYLDGALVCEYNRNPIKVLLSDCEKLENN